MPNSPVMPSVEEYQALLAERDALRGELRLVTAQRDLAEEKLRAYKHELFGASSEARHADQLGLFNEAEALATTTDAPAREDMPGTSVAAHTRGKRGRKPLDPNLPREVVRHELPESERFCAHDGHAFVEIGVETSEQLDVIPEQVRVVQHQRVKYACPCCDLGIKVTPAPARIIPRGLLTESALAWIITGKYQYGMLLYRQATLLRRFGGDISSNTLAASVVRVGLATQPVINLMRDALLESNLIYGDETTFQVLKEPGRRPQAKSYLWAQINGSGPPVRMFSYSPGRGAQHAQKLYAGVQPGTVLMTDVYERLPFAQASVFRISTEWVADVYPGLLQPFVSLRPPMKSADSHLTGYSSLALSRSFRFRESRSNLSCHHTQSLRNLSTFVFHKLHSSTRVRLRRFDTHISFLIGTVVGQDCPDCSCHLVRQRDDHLIRLGFPDQT